MKDHVKEGVRDVLADLAEAERTQRKVVGERPSTDRTLFLTIHAVRKVCALILILEQD